jgi:hypothetical protein
VVTAERAKLEAVRQREWEQSARDLEARGGRVVRHTLADGQVEPLLLRTALDTTIV